MAGEASWVGVAAGFLVVFGLAGAGCWASGAGCFEEIIAMLRRMLVGLSYYLICGSDYRPGGYSRPR